MSKFGAVLSLNARSSSVKFVIFAEGCTTSATMHGEIEDIDSSPHLLARDSNGATGVNYTSGPALAEAVVAEIVTSGEQAAAFPGDVAVQPHQVCRRRDGLRATRPWARRPAWRSNWLRLRAGRT